MNVRARSGWLATALALLSAAPQALAQREFTVGLRANALHAPGARIDTMQGPGLTTTLLLGDGWTVTMTLDRYDYDIRNVVPGLTIAATPTARSHVLGVAAGRRQPFGKVPLDWFWNAGIAVGFADANDGTAVDSAGDAFDVPVTHGTEIHLTAALGTTWHATSHWSITTGLRAESHYIDLRIADPARGRPLRVISMTPIGAYLSLNYRFGD